MLVFCQLLKKYILGDLLSARESRILPEREKEGTRSSAHSVELNMANASGMPVQSTNGGGVDYSRILVSLKSENSKKEQSSTKHSELLS
ncbi:hypothetical protein ACH3XW_3960 [Acanthocheilonema viteae]